MSIHPRAVVDSGAELGKDVVIGPGAVIAKDVQIGDGCDIGPNVVIHRYTSLGPGCVVHAGSVLGDLPQDLSFKNEPSYVKIGANCKFREFVTIHRGSKRDTATVIGDNCYIMSYAHCGHNCTLGNGVILVSGVLLAGYVDVGDRAFLGGGAKVHQFCRVGRLAMVGGNSAASKDVPPFCTSWTMQFNRVAGVNVIGLRRAGMGPAERLEVKQAFAFVYRSGLNVTQGIEKIRATFASGPALEFASFIEQSKRGICRFGASGEDQMDDAD